MTGYSYAIKNTRTGAHKLGKTKNLKERLSELQVGNEDELILTDFVSMPQVNLSKEEKKMHNHFKQDHIRGEWYDITEEQAVEYLNEVKKKYVQTETIEGLTEYKIVRRRNRKNTRRVPPCFFYPEQQAQERRKGKFDKTKYRHMIWEGVSEGHPSYATKDKATGLSRVFISGKKHKENNKQRKFLRKLNPQSTLEEHYA